MKNNKYPKVMIGTMIKNAEKYLPSYFNIIKKLKYPKENIRIVFIMAKGVDKSLDIIKEFKKSSKMAVEVYSDPIHDEWLWKGGIYANAAIWNDLQNAMKDEEYYFFLDLDLVEVPSTIIQDLMDVDAAVVAPYVWSENHRHFYDNYVFRINNYRFHPEHPPGEGLKFPIEVDSVGTCFLVKGHVWKNTKITNPEPYFAFARNVRGNGHKIVACPYIEVFHVDLEKLGIFHNPPPKKWSNWGSGWVDSKIDCKIYRKGKNVTK